VSTILALQSLRWKAGGIFYTWKTEKRTYYEYGRLRAKLKSGIRDKEEIGGWGIQMQHDKKMYIRLRHRLQVKPKQKVTLNQMSQYIVHPSIETSLSKLLVHEIKPSDEHLVVIDIMKVIDLIREFDPELEVESFGPTQTIVEVINPRKSPQFLLVLFVWLLLFVGSGLAIMNFHEDVSMLAVHQKVFKMITGEEQKHPLLLQIPYSFGIGIGMILFFNHLFKKRFNEEPSPLEVEMFLYQQNLDQYVVMHENREVQKKLDDST
jgi:stage V sporulation protein AA